MAGWHHWLDGQESEWTPGVGDRQGGLVCCNSWGRKELDKNERLNWTELNHFREITPLPSSIQCYNRKFKTIHILDFCKKPILSLWKLTYSIFILFILLSNFQSWYSQFLFWEILLHYFFEVFCFFPIFFSYFWMPIVLILNHLNWFPDLSFLYCFSLCLFVLLCDVFLNFLFQPFYWVLNLSCH